MGFFTFKMIFLKSSVLVFLLYLNGAQSIYLPPAHESTCSTDDDCFGSRVCVKVVEKECDSISCETRSVCAESYEKVCSNTTCIEGSPGCVNVLPKKCPECHIDPYCLPGKEIKRPACESNEDCATGSCIEVVERDCVSSSCPRRSVCCSMMQDTCQEKECHQTVSKGCNNVLPANCSYCRVEARCLMDMPARPTAFSAFSLSPQPDATPMKMSRLRSKPAPMAFGLNSEPEAKPMAMTFGLDSKPEPKPMAFGLNSKPEAKPMAMTFGPNSKPEPKPMAFGLNSKPEAKPMTMTFGLNSKPEAKPMAMSFGLNSKPKLMTLGAKLLRGEEETTKKPYMYGMGMREKKMPYYDMYMGRRCRTRRGYEGVCTEVARSNCIRPGCPKKNICLSRFAFTCRTIRCRPGQICVNVQYPCWEKPCPVKPKCIYAIHPHPYSKLPFTKPDWSKLPYTKPDWSKLPYNKPDWSKLPYTKPLSPSSSKSPYSHKHFGGVMDKLASFKKFLSKFCKLGEECLLNGETEGICQEVGHSGCESYNCRKRRRCLPVEAPSCTTTRCEPSSKCVLKEVQCIKAPCNPQPTCLPEGPKAGMCPKIDDVASVCAITESGCDTDSDCPDYQKCCDRGCGKECVKPDLFGFTKGDWLGEGDKEEEADYEMDPMFPLMEEEGESQEEGDDVSTLPETGGEDAGLCGVKMCNPGEECVDTNKCGLWDFGCISNYECVEEQVSKPTGVCPKNEMVGICAITESSCSDDEECPVGQMCCNVGCGNECVDPVDVSENKESMITL